MYLIQILHFIEDVQERITRCVQGEHIEFEFLYICVILGFELINFYFRER